MKNPENIKNLNRLVISYMSLKGMQGISLEKDNPFIKYYLSLLMSEMLSIEMEEFIVPNKLVYSMIEKAFELYNEVDNIENKVDPKMKDIMMYYMEDNLEYKELISKSKEEYKDFIFKIVINFNSKNEEYNKIKLKILEDKMFEYAELEEYENAAEIKNKIEQTKKRIN